MPNVTDLRSQLARYLRHVGIERGRSANTVAAYRRDLEGFLTFVEERGTARTLLIQERQKPPEVPPVRGHRVRRAPAFDPHVAQVALELLSKVPSRLSRVGHEPPARR